MNGQQRDKPRSQRNGTDAQQCSTEAYEQQSAPQAGAGRVVCSVPHSGTRTLVEHLGLKDSPRGFWLHFGYDDALLKKHKDLHLHIPLRHPHAVAASWARRGKNIDRLLAAYHSMFAHLTRPHTVHKMELLPTLAGGDDWDREVHGDSKVSGYVDKVHKEVVLIHAEFFNHYYGDMT